MIKRYDAVGGKAPYELYNLAEDLGETEDLAQAKPEMVLELDAVLAKHLKAVGAKLPRPEPAGAKRR